MPASKLTRVRSDGFSNSKAITLPGSNGDGRAFVVLSVADKSSDAPESIAGPILTFDPASHRWKVLPTPWSGVSNGPLIDKAVPLAVTPDNQGGFWMALRHQDIYITDQSGRVHLRDVDFYHYTDRVPRPVFEDAAHPIRQPIVGTAAGSDGRTATRGGA